MIVYSIEVKIARKNKKLFKCLCECLVIKRSRMFGCILRRSYCVDRHRWTETHRSTKWRTRESLSLPRTSWCCLPIEDTDPTEREGKILSRRDSIERGARNSLVCPIDRLDQSYRAMSMNSRTRADETHRNHRPIRCHNIDTEQIVESTSLIQLSYLILNRIHCSFVVTRIEMIVSFQLCH